MAQYGEVLQEIDYQEPVRNQMYKDFNNYFNNPVLSKQTSPDGVHSMYMCKSYSLLSNECRYIIVFVLDDTSPNGTEKNLIDLKWVSLHTRTFLHKEGIKMHGYNPQMSGPLTAPIIRKKVEKEHTIYSCDKYPITVYMLHTNKKTADDYQPRGNIISALETYNTMIFIK